ncbi:hypothetical protein PQO03_19180 [Lentisphaera profundi]|uniref:SLA1 homology domain-containing protein n=1 Tax=Lentisphaera profundi TaxID=1658616 RepID=A0ABY7VUR0_9BACT|nr:hypothetical protein [Lentisphaera profundi]WDE97953.1 hypothetical protein PQO03_19180 [Lentisphaera profundi]
MKFIIMSLMLCLIKVMAADATIMVSLADLKANQTKFSGKRVITQGKLFFTDKKVTSRTKVYLKDGSKFGKTYLLQLKPEELKSPELVNGNSVTVEVSVYGSSSMLRSCVFKSLDDKTLAGKALSTPEMSFKEFAGELDNLHQCREKYKGKILNLTGYYPLQNNYSYYSSFSGTNYTYFRVKDSSFYIYYAKDTLKDFEGLRHGDKINIKAKLSDDERQLDVAELKVLEKFADRKAMKVDLGRVVDAYKKDMIKADDKYKQQKLSFRDEIYDMSIEASGEASVTIRRSYEYIYCKFSKEQTRRLARYSKGDKIRLEGFHRGGDLNYLYNCQVK